MCVHYEAPFIYLLFGRDKVFLQDTGATSAAHRFPLRQTVDRLISDWLAQHKLRSIELIITHSHGHGDHVAADGQFVGRPETQIVSTGEAAVKSFFRITNWPEQIVQFDLGQRILDVMAIPGHIDDHVAVFDRQTGVLLTGDTVYPGNLYIGDWDAYKSSIERLTAFCAQSKVEYVLGTHIEMTSSPGVPFDFQSTFHPNEHRLQLCVDHIRELNCALQAMGDNPVQETHNDFIIVP